MGNYEQAPLQSAARALRVIQLLSQRGVVSLTEVARELDVSPSMAHRLLATCCATDYARQDTAGSAYTVGPALHELALGASHAGLLQAAGASVLAKAQRELGETVSIVILEGRSVRFVEALEGDGVIKVSAPIGRTFPAHATAAGRALLACLPADDLERRYPTLTLPKAPAASRLQTWADLEAELDSTRRRGWAVQVGEADRDLMAVAFAVVDGLGEPRAAINATAPRSRYPSPEAAAELASRLAPFARSLQRRLRGSR